MTGIDDAALLAVVAIASALGASALPRASWPRRSPAAAILLWQALGLGWGLAAVNGWLRLRRCGFRTYQHSFADVAATANAAGLTLAERRPRGLVWESAAFAR